MPTLADPDINYNRIEFPEPDTSDIRDLRDLAGITQTALAEALGVKQATVARWENGTRKLTDDELSNVVTTLQTMLVEHAFQLYTRSLDAGQWSRKLGKKHPEQLQRVKTFGVDLAWRMHLAAVVATGEELVAMPREYWERLFASGPKVYKGVRPRRTSRGDSLLVGYDVGVALDAAIRGTTYVDRADQLGGPRSDYYEEYGRFRLVNEINLTVEELQVLSGKIPTTKEEWLAFEPLPYDVMAE